MLKPVSSVADELLKKEIWLIINLNSNPLLLPFPSESEQQSHTFNIELKCLMEVTMTSRHRVTRDALVMLLKSQRRSQAVKLQNLLVTWMGSPALRPKCSNHYLVILFKFPMHDYLKSHLYMHIRGAMLHPETNRDEHLIKWTAVESLWPQDFSYYRSVLSQGRCSKVQPQ